MELPAELHLRIVEELLLDENLVYKKIYLHHYDRDNYLLETSLYHKARQYYPTEVLDHHRTHKRAFQTESETLYHPLLSTCKSLSEVFKKISDEQSLYVVNHYPFSRGADDPGPHSPRRRFASGGLERVRRIGIVAKFTQECRTALSGNPPEWLPILSFHENIHAIFFLFGPAYQVRYPRTGEINFHIEMIDWWLEKVEAFDAQFIVPHVIQLTLTIRVHSLGLAALGLSRVILTLNSIIAQFPNLTKLHVDWIMARPHYKQAPQDTQTALLGTLSPLTIREILVSVRHNDIQPAEIGRWDHTVI